MSLHRFTSRWGVWSAAIALGMSGCLESEYPLAGEADAKVDERLIGEWKREDAAANAVVRRSERYPRALEIPAFLEDEPAYTLEIADRHYLSFRERKEGKFVYSFARYQLSPDEQTVSLTFLNEAAVEKAITKKQVAGGIQVVKSSWFFGLFPCTSKTVWLSDTPANLRKFVERHGDECFRDPDGGNTLTFHRVAEEK